VRNAFHDRLDTLTQHLAQMCHLARESMEFATQALLRADLVTAEDVIASRAQFACLRASAEQRAFMLPALQAPVAGDLRAVVVALQNTADVTRMGARAQHVAHITRRRHPAAVLPADVTGYFTEMGRLAVELGNSTRDVMLTPDPQQAVRIGEHDDAMDDLHRHLFTVLLDREWNHGVTAAVDVTLLSRYYERFADHAVDIAHRMIFQATGTHG
jgi:phosphate transport system protein